MPLLLEGPEFKDTPQKKKPPPLEPAYTDGGRNAEITKATVEPDNEGGRDAEIEELKRTAARAQKALENKMAEFKDKPKPQQRTNRKSDLCRRQTPRKTTRKTTTKTVLLPELLTGLALQTKISHLFRCLRRFAKSRIEEE